MEHSALAQRIRQGDRDACTELVARYGKMVYYAAYAEFEDRDKSLDVSKRAFRELFTTLRKGVIPDDFSGYLQNQVRVQSKCLKLEESIMEELLPDIQASEDVDFAFEGLMNPPASQTGEMPAFEQPKSPIAAAIDVRVPQVPAAYGEQSPTEAFSVSPASVEPLADSAAPILPSSGPDVTDEMFVPHAIENAISESDVVGESEIAGKDSDLYRQFYGQAEKVGHKKSVGIVFGTIMIIILVALLVWLLVGFLIKLEIVSPLDLGYAWFNLNIFPLF